MNDVAARVAPFSIDVGVAGQARAIDCREVLRRLPERRLVGRGVLEGQDVAVKLFVGAKARRDQAREERGLSCLAEAGVPAPRAVGGGRYSAGWWIAVEWIEGRAAVCEDMAAIVEVNARLHVAGVAQKDPHLGNYIVSGERVFTIDGGGVRRRRMGRRGGLEGLALQLAALDANPVTTDAAYARYCATRGWREDRRERAALHGRVARMQRRRVRRFLKKTLRRCTQFEVGRAGGREVVYERVAMCEELARLLEDPDGWLERAVRLKDGNTATVARVHVGARTYVVKRYNAKGARARRAWMNGHRLCFRGIATARPLALLARGGQGPAYLVLEDLGDVTLADHIARQGMDTVALDGVARLFEALSREGLTHRDTKASNFLVIDDTVALVDLDALRPARRRGEIASDRERFLRNWDAATAAAFAARFEAVP